jgi:hypothetical protein
MSDSYFRWLHYHPAEAEALRDVPADVVSALWAAGVKAGRRQAMQSSSYIQVVPLLQALLDELVEDRVDQEFESTQPSTYWSEVPS